MKVSTTGTSLWMAVLAVQLIFVVQAVAQSSEVVLANPKGGSGTTSSEGSQPRPTALVDMPKGLGFDDLDAADVERFVYRRAPVRVTLPVGKERLVTFPSVMALHAPEGFESAVRFQIIERTAYIKALVPFGNLRVVAEDIATGRQIPLDLVSMDSGRGAAGPIEVFLPGQANGGQTGAAQAGGTPTNTGFESAGNVSRSSSRPAARPEDAPLDMVGLTRYAAQYLYGPKRLIPAIPSVRQMPMNTAPVEGLYRGAKVSTTPLGAWRSGQLYVTAILLKNLGQQPIDVDLQELRGQWLAATAQHTRLLGADGDWAATTLYLVCDKPFAACR